MGVPESSLATSEGALVCISISVEPRDLESLLEALAQVSFPINPQIYHDAAIVYEYPGGRHETCPTTLVEFPAYEGRLPEVNRTLAAFRFDPSNVSITSMLDEIHAGQRPEPAPAGAPYLSRYRVKCRALATAC